VNAVLRAGATALMAKRQGSGTGQTDSVVDLLEQRHTAVTDDATAIECRLDNAPSSAPKLTGLIGTL
jgi:serine kinase of HPr protein (carbohydrate metabolism regulator)